MHPAGPSSERQLGLFVIWRILPFADYGHASFSRYTTDIVEQSCAGVSAVLLTVAPQGMFPLQPHEGSVPSQSFGSCDSEMTPVEIQLR
jgi:hypothetical protein